MESPDKGYRRINDDLRHDYGVHAVSYTHLRQDLSIDADLVIRRRGAAGLCKGQFEIIVTGKAQRTACLLYTSKTPSRTSIRRDFPMRSARK